MKGKLLLLAVVLTCATSFAQNQITSSTAPATAAVGTNIIAGFTYNATVAGSCQIQLFRTDAAGNIDYGAGGTPIFFTSSVPAGTAQTIAPTFTIPNTVAPTNTLPAGQVYKWFYKLTVAGTDYYGSNNQTTITAPLATKEFGKVSSNEIFFDNKAKRLIINTNNVTADNAIIYDLNGKKVITISKMKQTQMVDLSSLPNGGFILVTDDNKTLKLGL